MEGYKVYVINLKRSIHRLKLMKSMYDNSKMEIIEGYDGKILYSYDDITLPQADIYSKQGKKKNEILSKYEVAVSFSHLKAIKTAYENNEDYALILEDDICNTYSQYWEKSLTQIIQNRPKDTECLLLFNVNPRHSITLLLSQREYVPLNYEMHWSAGCYFITRAGIEKICKLYIRDDKLDLSFADDLYKRNNFTKQILVADRKLLYPNLITYHYTRPTFTDACVKSTIHAEHKLVHAINHDILMGYFRRLPCQHSLHNSSHRENELSIMVSEVTCSLLLVIINALNTLIMVSKTICEFLYFKVQTKVLP